MTRFFLPIIMILVTLIGCQPTSTIPMTVDDTEDDLNLQQMLVYPQELGWPDANYDIRGGHPNDYIHPDYPQMDVIKIESRPFLNSRRYIDPRMMAQNIYVYADESTAKEVYDIDSEYFRISLTTEPSKIILEDILAGCTVDPENRSSLRCNVGMGYGIYYVHGFMYLDDDKITLDHWDQYMILMQEKLVERVERDNSS